MDHPIKQLVLDLLDAEMRRDVHRTEEIHRTLANRGYRVVVERCEPPKLVRELQAESPPAVVGARSPAEEATYLLNRPRGHRGAGNC